MRQITQLTGKIGVCRLVETVRLGEITVLPCCGCGAEDSSASASAAEVRARAEQRIYGVTRGLADLLAFHGHITVHEDPVSVACSPADNSMAGQ